MLSRLFTRAGRRRRAAAVVEMAIVSPVLFTMLFGIIEYGWVFTIKQTLTNAAREGCRAATLEGSTDTAIRNTITDYLSATGLKSVDYSIELAHATTANPIEKVAITVPYEKVSLMGGFFSGRKTSWSLGSTCTMRKEGMN
jgi:Flp pilus assembly protein TadG